MRKKKDQELSDMLLIAQRKGYKVYPTAQRQIRDYIKKAQKAGVIRTKKDSTICAAALVSFGIETANTRKACVVSIRDIDAGFRNNLKGTGCPGNTPPHRCFSRTVLSSVNRLRATKPLFTQLMDESLEKGGEYEIDV